MILYFSGTGNSKYIASRIGEEIKDDVKNLFQKIKDNDYTTLESKTPWIIVAPTYAWRIPRILETWLKKTKLTGNQNIYFVMTCGGNIGNAGKYLKRVIDLKNMNYQGCYELVMPENYIALFSTPTKEDALKTIYKAENELSNIVSLLKEHKAFPKPIIHLKDRMNSGIVNIVFYPMFVHAKKFYVKETCISCGKCMNVCPLNNIEIMKGKPIWKKNCTHCMACINFCPTEAIEYGHKSQGQPRYRCPK